MTEDAFVLWLDMLGYKAWLERQSDLEVAEHWLRQALRFAFKRAVDLRNLEPMFFDIDAILISDTIILSSHRLDPNIFVALVTLYHLLHCELIRQGLPLRGALAKGPLRIGRDFPYTILGKAVARCANLEKQVKAFVVAVDSSFMDYLASLPKEEADHYMILLATLSTKENGKEQKRIVLKWYSGLLPNSLMRYYDDLVARGNTGDLKAIDEFCHFCPKLLNSREMIKTIEIAPDDPTMLKREWELWLNKAAQELNEIAKIRDELSSTQKVE